MSLYRRPLAPTLVVVDPHPFESAGLGKPPFRIRPAASRVPPFLFDAPAPLCAWCHISSGGTLWVGGVTGRLFAIHGECLLTVTRGIDRRLYAAAQDATHFLRRAAQRERQHTRRYERHRDRYERALTLLARDPTWLTDVPHPEPRYAAAGQTLRDYTQWVMAHGSETALHEICRYMARHADGLPVTVPCVRPPRTQPSLALVESGDATSLHLVGAEDR